MPTHTFASLTLALFREFDIIHIHSVEPALLAPLVRWKTRVVATSHGQAYRRGKWGPLARWISRRAEPVYLRTAHACIAVSKTLKSYYEARYGRRVEYIPNGVVVEPRAEGDALEKFGLSPSQYLLFAGRLDPTKGCRTALEAYLLSGRPEPFVVMGGSTYTDEYVAMLRSSYASESIRFIGHQTGSVFWQVLQNAKAFIFPSEIEGLSIALLEAMSQSLPIVYSDIPENREVADGVGLSFRTGDARDLASKLGELLADDAEARRLGRLAFERVKRDYNWESVTDMTEAVYREALHD
jgi:glycosyltransferase involved in cell wall biosynthesis